MSQEQKKAQKSKEERNGDSQPPKPNPEVVAKGKKLKEDMDDLIEEIDDRLEENAEGFVKSYVQRGGE